jgi:hypothetical protein
MAKDTIPTKDQARAWWSELNEATPRPGSLLSPFAAAITEIESRAPSWHQAELACFGAARIELLLRIGKKLARQPCGT